MGIIKIAVMGVLANGLALYILTLAVDEVTYTGGFKFFLMGGIFLGLMNFFVKPIIKIFSLPFVILTGGLFLIVINAAILWVMSYFFTIAEFRDVTLTFPNLGSYVIGAVVLGLINWGMHLVIKK